MGLTGNHFYLSVADKGSQWTGRAQVACCPNHDHRCYSLNKVSPALYCARYLVVKEAIPSIYQFHSARILSQS